MNKLQTKTILTDVDGVLLNWVAGFETFMNEKHNLYTKNTTSYALSVRYGIDPAKELGYIEEFNHSHDIGFLKPLRDSVDVIAELKDDGYRLVVITSLSKNDSSCRNRVSNLERVFGADVFEDFIFLDIGERKNDALAKFKGTGLPWVEDLPKNALDGHEIGLDTYLIKHSYNAEFKEPGIRQVVNWKEISASLKH